MIVPDDVVERNEQLVRRLKAAGHLRDLDVTEAFIKVPRHLFVPPVAWACPGEGDEHQINRDDDPDAWWAAVYDDAPIITQLDDGKTDVGTGDGDYTSSCSAPSTVASLLELADLYAGQRVLEIGTGTGWTAALTSSIVGEDNVYSIEVDGEVAKQAAAQLEAAGWAPHLLVGDGATLCPEGGPFDRVHATCAVATVPYRWVEQTRPGGLIVTPFSPGFGYSHELRLTVMPDGSATGGFPGHAKYMMLRSQRRPSLTDQTWTASDITHATTRIDPRTIAYASAGADLAMFALTGTHTRTDTEGDAYTLWIIDPGNPRQWAAISHEPGRSEYEVQQAGDRPLWEEVTSAYFTWVSWGQPDRSRYGMTVTPEGQRIWLDSPSNPISPART